MHFDAANKPYANLMEEIYVDKKLSELAMSSIHISRPDHSREVHLARVGREMEWYHVPGHSEILLRKTTAPLVEIKKR
jgi:hypothetical protein